jgi:hypothetical protein
VDSPAFPKNGTPLKPDSISATVSALFKRLKIPKPDGAALHLLRHSHTSVLLSEGVPLAAVSARLGHSSVRTTQEIYAHMITGQDEEAEHKWEEYQKRNRSEKLGATGDSNQLPYFVGGYLAWTVPSAVPANTSISPSSGTELSQNRNRKPGRPRLFPVINHFFATRPARQEGPPVPGRRCGFGVRISSPCAVRLQRLPDDAR